MSTPGAIRGGQAGIEVFLDRTRLERDSRVVQARLRNLGNGLKNLGGQLAGAGLAAATPLTIAVRRFASFEAAMSSVKARLPDATDADFSALETKAADLGKSTAFTAREVAEAMEFLALAGFNATEILEGIAPVLDLAKSGKLELARASDIASDSLSGFGLATSQFARVVDVIALTVASANTDVNLLGETFKFAAPLAKLTGQRIETIAAAAGKLGDGAVKGTLAGTDLALMLKKLADPAVQKKLRELGVEPLDANGEIKNLVQLFEELGPAMANLTGAQQAATLEDMFGRATKSAGLLISAAADTRPGKSLRDLEGKLEGAEGAGRRMAETMGDNLEGEIVRTTSALDGLGNAVGKALGGDVREGMKAIQEYIGLASQWVEANQETVTSIGLIVAAAVGLGIAVVGVAGIVSIVASGVGVIISLVGAIASVPVAATLLAGALTAVGLAIAHDLGLLDEMFPLINNLIEKAKKLSESFHIDQLLSPTGRIEHGIVASTQMPEDFRSERFDKADAKARIISDPDKVIKFWNGQAKAVIAQADALRRRTIAELNKKPDGKKQAAVERELFKLEQLASAFRSRAVVAVDKEGNAIHPEPPETVVAEDLPAGPEFDFSAFDQAAADFKDKIEAAGEDFQSRLPKAFDLAELERGGVRLREFEAITQGLVDDRDSDVAAQANRYLAELLGKTNTTNSLLSDVIHQLDLPTDGEV